MRRVVQRIQALSHETARGFAACNTYLVEKNGRDLAIEIAQLRRSNTEELPLILDTLQRCIRSAKTTQDELRRTKEELRRVRAATMAKAPVPQAEQPELTFDEALRELDDETISQELERVEEGGGSDDTASDDTASDPEPMVL